MEKLKKFLNKPTKLLSRLLRRKPNLIFSSPKFAHMLARNKALKTNNSLRDFKAEKICGEVLIHEEVLAYPLGPGNNSRFSGGLINIRTQKLIDDAVHYDGDYCQELPTLNSQSLFCDNCFEIEYPILYGGILFNHFGHFLLESLGRLWAYGFVKETNPYILFYAPYGVPDYLDKKNYVNQVLEGFKIPHQKIVFVDKAIKINKVLVPAQKYGYGLRDSPDSVFLKFIRSFSFKNNIPKGFEDAENIYVSRSKMSISAGRSIGENLFEEYLLSNGYKILHPELYSLFQQLSVYKNAKKIIFCDGSALHGCILIPDLEAKVAIIARRRNPRWNGQRSTKQFQGYGKSVVWIDEVRCQYQFGLEAWHALSNVDWYKVSLLLKDSSFVSTSFHNFSQIDYLSLVKDEIKNFIKEIASDSRINESFIEFMMQIKKQYPS